MANKEDKVIKMYGLLKSFEIARKKKDFSYWKFIKLYIK